MESHALREHDGLPIRASVHRSRAASPSGTILYLHGGGCIFGTRDDLPQAYIDLFQNNGYNVVALDYLLAPESKLDEILDVLHETVLDVIGDASPVPDLDSGPLIVMGRSAGAFLALQLTARLVAEGGPRPAALLDFYGYGSLDEKEFRTKNRFYAAFACVDDRAYQASLSSGKLTESPLSTRYSAYVYHRQRGTWPETVLGGASVATTVIPGDVLAQFPPTLLVHSIYDPDVPFRCSKELARKIPGSKLVKVYDSDQHDFDRDPAAGTGLPIYRDAVEWLTATLQRQ